MKNPRPNSSYTPDTNGHVSRFAPKGKQSESAAELWQAAGLDLAKTTRDLRQVHHIDASRLVKLHAAISAGEYRVDSERVAQKILAFEAALRDESA